MNRFGLKELLGRLIKSISFPKSPPWVKKIGWMILGTVITIFILMMKEYWIDPFLHKTELSCQFEPIQNKGQVNLSFDDAPSDDYYTLSARLFNNSELIRNPFTIKFSLGSIGTWIKQVDYSVIRPTNKSISISTSFPDIDLDELDLPNQQEEEFEYDWNSSGADCFVLYHSLFRNVGFGRIGEQFVERNSASVKKSFLEPWSFISVTSVNCGGESDLAQSIHHPTAEIYQHLSDKILTLKQAQDDSGGPTIETEFLEGQVNVTFDGGLDPDSEILLTFYFNSIYEVTSVLSH